MTTFITFTETRKQQIDHLRNRLITERPYTHVYYGNSSTRVHPLGLSEYVVYAALRGADYRKGDHTGGKQATEALKGVLRTLTYWAKSDSHIGGDTWAKWLPTEHKDVELNEMIAALTDELNKWKDAPAVN